MQTFLEQQNEVLRFGDEVDDVDLTRTLVKEALNRSYRRLLTSRTWPFMKWPNEETLTTVAGTRAYALKPGLNRVLTLWDTTTRSFVPLIPRREWESMAVDRTEQVGVPVGAIYGDTWPVAAQPSTATTLRIVSSSASDTGSTKSVTVTGLDADSEMVSETLTSSGTSQVTSTNSFTFVMSVTKTGTWVGTMTLSTSGGTTLLTLRADDDGKQYPTLEFIETPSTARPYTYTAQRTPATLTLDGDIPATPFPYSEYHIYDTLLDLTGYNTELGTKEQRLWSSRRDEIMKALEESVDEVIAGSRPRFVRNMEPQRRRLITT